jgi:rod shape-determining protein MreB
MLLARDTAVDLGTANTLIHVRGHGLVLNEPSVVAVHAASRRPIAFGDEAKRMLGRAPREVEIIRPLRDGVVADVGLAELMLRHYLGRAHQRRVLAKPRMVVAVPSAVTQVERRAVEEAAYRAGARQVQIIEEPLAAAIGAGLSIEDGRGAMVVDIGGGTTDIAIISMGSIAASHSLRVGGDRLDEALIAYARKELSLALGERMAEEIKIAVGSVRGARDGDTTIARGLDLVTGLPKGIEVSSEDVRTALEEQVTAITDFVRMALEQAAPELAGDLNETGVLLTGGGAMLRGLDDLLGEETGLPIHVVDNPLESVVMGAAAYAGSPAASYAHAA